MIPHGGRDPARVAGSLCGPGRDPVLQGLENRRYSSGYVSILASRARSPIGNCTPPIWCRGRYVTPTAGAGGTWGICAASPSPTDVPGIVTRMSTGGPPGSNHDSYITSAASSPLVGEAPRGRQDPDVFPWKSPPQPDPCSINMDPPPPALWRFLVSSDRDEDSVCG